MRDKTKKTSQEQIHLHILGSIPKEEMLSSKKFSAR